MTQENPITTLAFYSTVNHVNRHLWKLSSVRCLNSVAPTQEPLSRPLSVQGLRFPVLRSLFSRSRTGMTCFACVLRQVANPIHISEHSLRERPHLRSSLSCTLVHWTYAVMQKSSQKSIISANIKIQSAAAVRGMLISSGTVVDIVNKKLNYISIQ